MQRHWGENETFFLSKKSVSGGKWKWKNRFKKKHPKWWLVRACKIFKKIRFRPNVNSHCNSWALAQLHYFWYLIPNFRLFFETYALASHLLGKIGSENQLGWKKTGFASKVTRTWKKHRRWRETELRFTNALKTEKKGIEGDVKLN